MDGSDFKQELKDIEESKKSFKTAVICFILFLIGGIILGLIKSDGSSSILSIVCYVISSISFILMFVFKISELECMVELSHKRLDEMVDKFEELKKKS